MTNPKALQANRSMPACTVIPELAYDDVLQASDWLCAAFGFAERWRAGRHRAHLTISDGAVALTEQRHEQGPSDSDGAALRDPRGDVATHAVMVRVADVDAHYERAREHGARILQPPTDHPFGERQYTTEDIAGHRWTFSQTIADVAPEHWGGTSSPRWDDGDAGTCAGPRSRAP